ncbi:hypothetical protein GCM10022378_06220 [Salinicoccus jeotgali]|uniref:Rhodanese domain-containing protein n=1 Tax=Salinicoccus jeotgali TaxID=381634 RepID=A0ABP7EIC1_9STAP
MSESIEANELQDVIQDEDKVLIDVREKNELEETGFVPGAEHYPMSDFENAISSLDKDKTYYVMCRSGKRSEKVQHHLIDNGYKALNVEGGILAYDGPLDTF